MDTQRLPPVTMIGIGGIGTAVLPVLTRLPFDRILLWDDDFVSEENFRNQLFWMPTDVGLPKAAVAASMLRSHGQRAAGAEGRYTSKEYPLYDEIVIAAVDSLASRRAIWDGVMRASARTSHRLFLDGRLSRESPYLLQFFIIPLDDPRAIDAYQANLLGDDIPDSGRRDPDMIAAPLVLSGYITKCIMRWSRGDHLPWQVVWDGVGGSLVSFSFD